MENHTFKLMGCILSLTSACGGAAVESESLPEGDGDTTVVTQHTSQEVTQVEDSEEPKAAEEPAAPRPPCYHVDRALREAYPNIDVAFETAQSYWPVEFEPESLENGDCMLSLSVDRSTRWGITSRYQSFKNVDAVIGINPDRVSTDESCSGSEVSLSGVLTHELGHVIGLHEDSGNGCAMCSYETCAVQEPRPRELREARGLVAEFQDLREARAQE